MTYWSYKWWRNRVPSLWVITFRITHCSIACVLLEYSWQLCDTTRAFRLVITIYCRNPCRLNDCFLQHVLAPGKPELKRGPRYGATVQAAAEEYLHGKIRIRVLWKIAWHYKTTDDILGPKVWQGLIETFSDFGVESCKGLFHARRVNCFLTSGPEVKPVIGQCRGPLKSSRSEVILHRLICNLAFFEEEWLSRSRQVNASYSGLCLAHQTSLQTLKLQ